MTEASQETPGWSQARVVVRQQWAPGLMTLRLAAQTEPFEAGQFFNLGLYVRGELMRRAYSAASAPGDPLEFFVARVDDGEFSPALFALSEQSSLWVEKKPQGFFTLRYVPDCENLWLVASGTGLGPFVSMLRSGEVWRRFGRVVVVHGVRDATQQAYQEELAALAGEHALNVVTCFSRGVTPPGAVRGRVTQALVSGELEAAAGVAISPEHSHLMLCGNPAMVTDMTTLLKERGLAKHRVRKPGHITTEKYW
jgi:ferredoxin/flavodoxin---NADP+ reductase